MKINGYLQQRNGKWYYRIKYTDEYGNKKDIMRKGGKTKAETSRLMAEKLKEIEENTNIGDIKFCDLFNLFIQHCEDKGLKPNTINHYKEIYMTYLSSLQNINIKSIKQKHIIDCYTGNFKSSTKQYIFNIFKLIYKYGYMLGYVSNLTVIERIETPRKKAENRAFITIDDYNKINDYLLANKDKNYKVFLLWCFVNLDAELGLRRGELCGLTWDCIDFANMQIEIKYNLVTEHCNTYITTPKTATSMRKLYLSSNAVAILRQLWAVTSENRLKCGGNYQECVFDGYNIIWRWQDGSGILPANFYIWFVKVQKNIGFDKTFKLHDLRHFNASLLINNDIDLKTVQQRLGHSSPSTTLGIYAHSFEENQKKAVSVLENSLKNLK